MDEKKARAKRARHFERRSRAASEGVHLPSLIELLRGMPMFFGQLEADASEFFCRVLMRMKNQDFEETILGTSLRILSDSTDVADFIEVAQAFAMHPVSRKLSAAYLEQGKRRCYYYAACKNDRDAMLQVAHYAIEEMQKHGVGEEVFLELGYAALGWLSHSAQPSFQMWNGHQNAISVGSSLFKRMKKEHDRQNGDVGVNVKQEVANTNKKDHASEVTANADPSSWIPDASNPSAIVVEELGNADLHQGRDVEREFKSVIGTDLPLCLVKNLGSVEKEMGKEFPHASSITRSILGRLTDRSYVHLRPILFVGPPGCGKTSYAQRLLQVLDVPAEVFPCGGTTDSAFQGTARRWSSGEPSVPMSLVRRYMVASPGIVLDELEKASSSRSNGSLFDCLLGLLEPRSASTWRDPYIQAHVNLSYVVWLGTANSLTGVPPTLLDRMSVMEFPIPDQSHLSVLATSILRRTLIARGYDERWAIPLDGEELSALSMTWPGGSMRQLQKLVEVVIDARNNGCAKQ